MESIKVFMDKLKTDEELQKKFVMLEETEDLDGIEDLMLANGVNTEDMTKLKEMKDSGVEFGALSDDSLEMVSGGKIQWTCAVIMY